MLEIYDSSKRKLVDFHPINNNKVGMYVCGVTVYDYCHVGHARSAVAFDIIYRYLNYKGYDVTFVKNFTDVDDKIIKRANETNRSCEAVAEKYIDEYYKDMEAIGIEKPTYEPKATDHIKEIIDLIQRLMNKGYAYEIDGDVYYRVEKFKEYGKLSHRNIDELKSGARVEIDERKESPLDFALWKRSKENEPAWGSPWGMGRPGWHIECSAMSMKYLGESFDIHGGGEDLIFPHHENEIAQSEAATGKEFVKYWIHNAFVKINKEKMSKSLGNFFTIRDILKQFKGEELRYFLLTTHYKSPLDFSFEGLEAAREALNRFYNFMIRIKEFNSSINNFHRENDELENSISGMIKFFEDSMDNDFNVPKTIGYIFHVLRLFNTYLDKCEKNSENADKVLAENFLENITKVSEVLGIFGSNEKEWFSQTGINDQWIESMIKARNESRKSKNFKKADDIRNELYSKNIILEDSKNGTRWKIKK